MSLCQRSEDIQNVRPKCCQQIFWWHKGQQEKCTRLNRSAELNISLSFSLSLYVCDVKDTQMSNFACKGNVAFPQLSQSC
uniref:Uncharacterized protein n=1 Tax=Oreochromis niloticus TaxID=8128 RepID=A0A669DWB9_ORENI